jgi:hypothetical protein
MLSPGFLKGSPWTDEAVARLREVYAEGGLKAACKAFPDRSYYGLRLKANTVGLKVTRVPWTSGDEEYLHNSWGVVPFKTICRQLKRTQVAVYCQAVHRMGLKGACPAGWEYLFGAAQRTGVSVYGLRRILAEANITPQEPYSIKKARKRPNRYRSIVRIADVNAAMRLRDGTETITSAARRLNLYTRDVADCLAQAGHKRPPGHQHWRLPSYVFDDAVKEFGNVESLRRAAIRLGVTRETLSRWLKQHGVNFRRSHIQKADIERVVKIERARPTCKAFGLVQKRAEEERQRKIAKRAEVVRLREERKAAELAERERRRQERILLRDQRRAEKAAEKQRLRDEKKRLRAEQREAERPAREARKKELHKLRDQRYAERRKLRARAAA